MSAPDYSQITDQRLRVAVVCPYCAAPKTNGGRLLHYGRYTGFACRSWVAKEGGAHRSEVCKSRQAFARVAPGKLKEI